MIMDLYQLVRDLIEEAREQKNIGLVDKLIEVKLAISELQEENQTLKKKLEQQNQIVRHDDGNYITLIDDPLQIRYCSTCWGNDNKLIQLMEQSDIDSDFLQCPICFNNWLNASNSRK